MPDTRTKCANGACNCDAADGSKYCSARCEELRGQMVTDCPCGHTTCAISVGASGSMPLGAR